MSLVIFGANAPREVVEAFWWLVGSRLPLNVGRDRLYVSAYAAPHLPAGWPIAGVIHVDRNLHGVEMRLERRS